MKESKEKQRRDEKRRRNRIIFYIGIVFILVATLASLIIGKLTSYEYPDEGDYMSTTSTYKDEPEPIRTNSGTASDGVFEDGLDELDSPVMFLVDTLPSLMVLMVILSIGTSFLRRLR